MGSFIKQVEVRWSDLDPNFHVLHSKYYDFGAYCRMAFLTENGCTASFMLEHHIGPILFREECSFKKEIVFGDKLNIDVEMTRLKKDYGKWSMVHKLWKNENILAAVITIDGAWMDTRFRKLTVPPALITDMFENFPRSAGFVLY